MESLSVGQTVVLTFGRDSNGELGRPLATEEAEAADPETDTRATGPQRVDLPTGIVSVGSGFYHSMAVSSSGELFTWGCGSGGQLGHTRGGSRTKTVGARAAPAPVSGLQEKKQHVLRVVAGRNHTCAFAAPSSTFTWGHNVHGQLGHAAAATSRKAEAHVLEPRQLLARHTCSRLAACGEYLSAAVTQQGEVLTWGRGANGRGGARSAWDAASAKGWLGGTAAEPHTLPKSAFGGTPVAAVALGWRHCLARTRDGLLFAWGAGGRGQLGLEACCDSAAPQLVEALARETVVALAAGGAHSLACTTEGVTYAWGEGGAGQLGLGARRSSVRPQGIASLLEQPPVVAIAAGGAHSAFVTSGGALLTCGDDTYGQLGGRAPAPEAPPPPSQPSPPGATAAADPFGAAATPAAAAAAATAAPAAVPTCFPDVPLGVAAPNEAPLAAPVDPAQTHAAGPAPVAPSTPAVPVPPAVVAALPNPCGTPCRVALPEALRVREVACGAYHTVVLASVS